jgi:hypothetical protein
LRRARLFKSGIKLQPTTKVNPQGVGGCAALTFVVSNLVRTLWGGR